MNLAQKYTDEIYMSRLEIEKQMPILAAHALWEEIVRYRALYRKKVILCEQVFEFVLTPAIVKQIQQAQDSIVFQEKPLILDLVSLSVIKEFEETFLFIQLFLLAKVKDSSLISFTIDPMYQEIFQLFIQGQTIIFNEQQEDWTRCFLESMNHVCFQYARKMIECRRKASTDPILLKQLYPFLLNEQCQFYVHHSKKGHYYDIKDYVLFHQCSYETGRCHLLKLAQCGLYRKIRIGKRDVYTI